ncbi:glycosyltransferase family 4 protein [Candidatus Woesearchaeota archaeon]|nr:glycosyltransferase family 4 protein [Candidatus Woesearchaeota archaeon]
MKIIYISEYFPYSENENISGGVENRCYNIAKRLAKNNNITVITSWKKGQARKQVLNNINVIRVGPNHEYSNEKNIISRLRFTIAAYNTAKRLKADITEGYNFITYLPVYYAAKKNHSKKIITYHEIWIGDWIKNKGIITGILGEIWERKTLSLKWDKIISVSNFTADKISKYQKRIKVIPNGIDLKQYNIKSKKYENPTIITVSRLTKFKRIKDIIYAIYLIKKETPNIKLIIAGKGDEINNLKYLTKKLKLENNVEFTGFIDNEKLKVLLKKSHIFCSASVLEGFGIVILEAMASGLPYVCSDIQAFKEVTNNGKGGFIFKKKNHIDLANKIKILIKNKKIYNQKTKEAKEIVNKYDWNKISEEIIKLYHESLIHK